MSDTQKYLAPDTAWALDDADLARLRQQVARADAAAGVPPQDTSAEALAKLKGELNALAKALADPGLDPATRQHAQSRADAVRAAIAELGRQHPVKTAGSLAANSGGDAPMSFE